VLVAARLQPVLQSIRICWRGTALTRTAIDCGSSTRTTTEALANSPLADTLFTTCNWEVDDDEEAVADDSLLVVDSAAVLDVAGDEPLELDEEPQAVAKAATISNARLRTASKV
jgi:hypothetical protein